MKKQYLHSSLVFLFIMAFITGTVFALHPTADPWIMYRHDNARSGVGTSTAPSSNKTLWAVPITYGYGPPLVYAGKVYYSGSSAVYALDETTGVELWHTSLTSVQAPLTIANGKLYTGSTSGYVYCLDAETGAKLWEQQVTSTGQIYASPIVSNGRVYVGTTDNAPEYNFYALNASTGAYIGTSPNFWRYKASKGIWSSPAVDGNMIYFGSEDGKLYAINTSLSLPSLKWTFTTNGRIRCPPVAYGDMIIFGSYWNDHSIFAINKTNGEMIWKYQLDNQYSIEQSIAVDSGVAYFTPNSYNKIYAIYTDVIPGNYTENDPTIKKWSRTQPAYSLSEPIVADSKLFFTIGYTLYALATSDGSPVWTYTYTQTLYDSIVADGRVFVTGYYRMICLGAAFPPVTYVYTVHAGGQDHEVILVINATAGPLDTSGLTPTLRTIAYNLTGITDTKGMSNITIPKTLMDGFDDSSVLLDGGLPTTGPVIVSNTTHTSLSFTYSHSYHTVTITSFYIIPEFPTALILPLLMITSLFIIALAKKNQNKN